MEPGHPFAWGDPEALAEQQAQMREKQVEAAADIPPVCIISLQKSGSSLVNSVLAKSLDIPWCCISFRSQKIDPSWLAWFAEGRAITHDHAWPHAENITTLTTVFPRIAVHIRDPRAAAVSLAHHNVGAASPEETENVYLGHIVRWLDGWLTAAEEHADRIRVFRYEDLVTDPAEYFNVLVNWCQIPERYLTKVDETIPEQMSDQKANNFRRGVVDGWRDEISSDLAEKLWERTPVRVKEAFERD